MNLLFSDFDSYKLSQGVMYPPDMTSLTSYYEARSGEVPYTVFFGLRAILKLNGFLEPITRKQISDVIEMNQEHFGRKFPHLQALYRIPDVHKGFVPIRIEALDEGTVVPTRVPMLQMTSLDPELAWLESTFENQLQRLWYPCNVATISYEMKTFITQAMEKSCDNLDGLLFKLHDFGSRGATCREAAMIGGMAHLLNFYGTDTQIALYGMKEIYNEDSYKNIGYSIPAAEHSTISAWGANEALAYRHILHQYPEGLVAIPCDTYDHFNAVSNIFGNQLRDEVLNRAGVLILRPDSGDPTRMVNDTIEVLFEKFGYSTNSKGFRVLPEKLRCIHGDGLNRSTLPQLLENSLSRGISIDNYAMGMGAGLLQKHNRDWQGAAIKACSVNLGDVSYQIFKAPKTDPAKASKRGRQAVYLHPVTGQLSAIRVMELPQGEENFLKPVFEFGKYLRSSENTLVKIRERVGF